jgi:TonB family protein
MITSVKAAVVEVSVDRSGKVTRNSITKGSTTLDVFTQGCKEAALKAKFNAKADAPVVQKGTITYNFKLR